MTAHKPVTPEEKETIIRLHGEGVSRNGIAKQVGRPSSTVGAIIHRAGLRFDTKVPEAMAQARTLNMKERQVAARERRLLIMELEDARQLAVLQGEAQWTTRVRTQGGGEEFRVVDFIPPDDSRNNASMAASHTSAFKNLAPLEVEVGIQEAKSMLDKVIESLGVPDE